MSPLEKEVARPVWATCCWSDAPNWVFLLKHQLMLTQTIWVTDRLPLASLPQLTWNILFNNYTLININIFYINYTIIYPCLTPNFFHFYKTLLIFLFNQAYNLSLCIYCRSNCWSSSAVLVHIGWCMKIWKSSRYIKPTLLWFTFVY